MKLDPTKINLLKEPFGVLIRNNEGDDNFVSKDKIIGMLSKAQKVITVGDTTTEKFVSFGFVPDISVIDGKEKRVIKTSKSEYHVDKILYLQNKPGELSEQVIGDIRQLISNITDSGFKIQIIIDGEEDLVALPFLIYSPNDWLICYGQPNEGLVIVKVTEDSRKRAELIFNKAFI